MLEIRCEFPDTAKFHAKYQRNNKRTGLKNLRCYPFCGPDGKHHENGFCGAAVRAVVRTVGGGEDYSAPRLCAWGELISKTETGPRFPVGSTFTKNDLRKVLRTDAQHLNPLFEAQGSTVSGSAKQFSFESHKKGWHYEWKGNKYTSEKPHAFVVYVAVPVTSDLFQCIGVFYSPLFTMFCRRRHKTVPEAEKHQLAEAVPEEESVFVHKLTPDGRVPMKTLPPPSFASVGMPSNSSLTPNMMPLGFAPPPPPRNSGLPSTSSSSSLSFPFQHPLIPMSSSSSSTATLSGAAKKKSKSDKKSSTSTNAVLTGNGKTSKRSGAAASGTSKKPRPDKDGSDLKVMRVLSAIANVDKLKKRLQQEQAKRSQSRTGGAGDLLETASTSGDVGLDSGANIDDLDMSWLDALTGPLQENFLGTDDFLSFKVSTVDDIFGTMGDHAQEDLNAGRAKAVEVVEALARYLVDEETFTAAIHDSATKSSYSDFILLIQKFVGDFLRERFNGMTIDDVDSALRGETPGVSSDSSSRKEMKSAFETLVSAALMREQDEMMDRTHPGGISTAALMGNRGNHSLSSSPSNTTNGDDTRSMTSGGAHFQTIEQQEASLGQQPDQLKTDIQLPPGIRIEDFLLPPRPLGTEEEPDVAGVWIRPETNVAEMAKMREQREIDWVQRQLLAKMEKRFEMEQPVRGEVLVRLSKKLLSAGVITYYLDAVQRPFPLTSPLGPASNLARSMLGWAVGPCVCFCNEYSDTERMIRVNWKVGNDELHGVHIYQSRGKSWGKQDGTPETTSPQQPSEAPGPWDMYPVTEDGWKVVHITFQICQRDKLAPMTSKGVTSTSSEAEDL